MEYSSTQIDFILTRRDQIKHIKDCKVIPGEPLTTQHRLLIVEFQLVHHIKTKTKLPPEIKWKRLSDPESTAFIENLIKYLRNLTNSEEDNNTMWSNFETFCIKDAKSVLGTVGSIAETHWW